MLNPDYRYHHIGIPTDRSIDGEEYLPDYKMYHAGYEQSEFGIEWIRFDEDCPLPDVVKTVPHVAFQVADLDQALVGKKVIIQPNSPSAGVRVAFIEENGAPVELLEIDEV